MDLKRFIDAQELGGTYAEALAELTAGQKYSHWIWFVFPTIRGISRSENGEYFAIQHLREADAYYRDATLGLRLAAATEALVPHLNAGKRLQDIVGRVDAKKVVACLTLFTHLHINAATAPEWHAWFIRDAQRVVAAGAAEGWPLCPLTLAWLAEQQDRTQGDSL